MSIIRELKCLTDGDKAIEYAEKHCAVSDEVKDLIGFAYDDRCICNTYLGFKCCCADLRYRVCNLVRKVLSSEYDNNGSNPVGDHDATVMRFLRNLEIMQI